MKRALLYARTVRHLRPVQLYGRALRALRSPRIDERPAPPVREARPMAAPADREPVLVGPTRVAMLGTEGELASPRDWDDPLLPALWRYHLHYFDDLRARDVEARRGWNLTLIDRWLREVRPEVGVGWDPYPTSLRIVNWVRFALAGGAQASNLHGAALHSLAVQARHLRSDLEVHLLGNHLFANAKALVFAGAFFAGDEAQEWLRKGLALLERELAEQVLSDGGHFERSAMYHSVILEDLLDLVALSQAAPDALTLPDHWLALISKMRAWLRAMCHPDGEIALFNDAAIGQAPSPRALEDYAQRLGLGASSAPREGLTHLDATGYIRFERDALVALLDVGEIGPSYLPGHAHADTLSFEASLGHARWIVDSGTSHYEPGPERLRQRETAAHNTVEVDSASSSEVWSSFRVARRARPRALAIETSADGATVACSHDGYRRLSGGVTHRREWRLGDRRIEVRDELAGRWTSAVARLHLHPSVQCAGDAATMEVPQPSGGSRTVNLSVEGATTSMRPSSWHPRFGSSLPSQRIESALVGAHALHRLTW
ncbi:MAG: alginate lyase family protein [Planctomycetota bacterium]